MLNISGVVALINIVSETTGNMTDMRLETCMATGIASEMQRGGQTG